ncbi:MAG: FAD-binding oxidoreductase [Chloroflexi bacterium]|nr:FAD-binding oxidoreductase [Chloroflexota bacterium]
MSGRRPADVAIAGGGIIGCFVAYYLAKRGLKPVVIEATGIGSQASGRAAGIITPSWGPVPRELLRLHAATLRMHAQLARELPNLTGIDYGYELIPHVRLVLTAEGVNALKRWRSERLAEGATVEWLSPADARRAVPYLSAEPIGGTLSEIEPQCDAFEFVRAVARAARLAGTAFISGKVSGAAMSGGRVTAFNVEDGSQISAGSFVVAMGPWSGLASKWLGVRVPVEPQRGQLFTLSEGSDPTRGAKIGVWAWDTSGFILPKRIGGTIIGTTREDGVGFDRGVTAEGRRAVVANARKLASEISAPSIVAERACLRPVSADGNPLIGRVPGLDNAYLATGHGGNGIHFGPITGLAVAELISEGKPGTDLSAFDPERFVHAGAARGA